MLNSFSCCRFLYIKWYNQFMKLDVKRYLTDSISNFYTHVFISIFLIEDIILLMKFHEVLQHLYFSAFWKKEGIFQQLVSKYPIRTCFKRNGIKCSCLWKRLSLDFLMGSRFDGGTCSISFLHIDFAFNTKCFLACNMKRDLVTALQKENRQWGLAFLDNKLSLKL